MTTRSRIVVALALLALAVPSALETAAFGQSGRHRAETRRAAVTPTFSNEDVAVEAVPEPVAVPDEIAWVGSFDDAKRVVAPKQVIFVSVHAPWCGWCRFMDSRVYTDPGVREFAAGNVFVKINAEDGGAGTSFARAVGVRSFPTLLVYSSDGKLIGRQIGAFRRASDFLDWLVYTAERS
jgi:thioredoxin-related protein